MRKVKIYIERPLRSRSASSIWMLISTPAGLSRWIAEQVSQEGDMLSFTWGKPGQVYQTRCARIVKTEKNTVFRFVWEDETDPEAYTELSMQKLDITGEYALCITDFSEPDDVESMTYMWNHDLDRLRHKMGI